MTQYQIYQNIRSQIENDDLGIAISELQEIAKIQNPRLRNELSKIEDLSEFVDDVWEIYSNFEVVTSVIAFAVFAKLIKNNKQNFL